MAVSDPRAAWRVVERFEEAICEYTGATHCVAVDSCTNALYLCFVRAYRGGLPVMELPSRTYVGVPRAAMRAGWKVRFYESDWINNGEYGISVPGAFIVDSARFFAGGMCSPTEWRCVSFHATKHLPIGRGGAILCDRKGDAEWFRRARYDGRDQTRPILEQEEFQWGMQCYLEPEKAARGLMLLQGLPDHNEPLPATYPDLRKVKFT